MRGEYPYRVAQLVQKTELPPRARRILLITDFQQRSLGTTSACAENTGPQRHRPPAPRNYLRVRGEYSSFPIGIINNWELPPRARRILLNLLDDRAQRGTTSACAENTSVPWRIPESGRNYLRVRGEYDQQGLVHRGVMELPPRARRIPFRHIRVENMHGTTSACAENTKNRQ